MTDVFERVLADRRDIEYADSPPDTWQEAWFDKSNGVTGLVLKRIAAAWSCTIKELLGPCEARCWADTATYRTQAGDIYEAEVLLLRRPDSRGGKGCAG